MYCISDPATPAVFVLVSTLYNRDNQLSYSVVACTICIVYVIMEDRLQLYSRNLVALAVQLPVVV
jgi:hypothetical protein